MNQQFGAPWGKGLCLMTGIASLILLGIPIFGLINGFSDNEPRYILVGLPLAIYLACFLFIIRGYRLSDGVLNIQRLLWVNKIDLTELRFVSVDPNAMKKSIRTFGNGGLFSFSGLFKNPELGSYRAFVTDPPKAVVLKFANRTIVVTPDRPEEFATLLSTMVHKKSVG